MKIRDILFERREVPWIDLVNITAHVLATEKERLYSMTEKTLEPDDEARIDSLIRQRMAGRPLAYITGKKEFFSRDFSVDERVLIPRPETELLVEEALHIIEKKTGPLVILDMGTGSGAIGLVVAERTGQYTLCVDISAGALEVAMENGAELCRQGRVNFICSDLFGGIRRGTMFDLILANLPYVTDDEWGGLMDEVRDYEPEGALLGGIDGLVFYERLAEELPYYLKRDGQVVCEIGGNSQGHEMKEAFRSLGLASHTLRDFSGTERIVIGSWTNLS